MHYVPDPGDVQVHGARAKDLDNLIVTNPKMDAEHVMKKSLVDLLICTHVHCACHAATAWTSFCCPLMRALLGTETTAWRR